MAALIQTGWVFDGLLGLGLLWLAWRVLNTRDLFQAIVLFVAFGLLMALAWVRLDAPDVALAEAAIGAGLTGALLLAALARLRRVETDAEVSDHGPRRGFAIRTWQCLQLAASLLAAGGLAWVLLSLPTSAEGLSTAVAANLDTSGVRNPVTAVLLNFRGYDTLLEMAVLLLALLAVWSIGGGALHGEAAPGAVLDMLARLLTPVLILVAAYLLWVGAHAPGGAFQAGSVLGAAGVLLLLTGWRLGPGLTGVPLRLTLSVGPGAFVVVAALTLMSRGALLEYPPEYAAAAILLLETAATISIGVILAALFLGGTVHESGGHR